MHKKHRKFSVHVRKMSAVVGIVTMTVTAIPGFYNVARAFDAGAFFGGMAAGHVVGGMVRRSRLRTAAAMDMARSERYAVSSRQAAPTIQSQPAPAPKPTAEQRLHQLDKLAAGGYITPAEYKSKRQAILDSM